jgi:hypothetical protein
MAGAQEQREQPGRDTHGLSVHKVAHGVGFLILVAALSVAGTYWMVGVLRQAIQHDGTATAIEASTLQPIKPTAQQPLGSDL